MIKHLTCIMDGNRRWAKQQGLMAFNGHRKGAEVVQHVAQFCLDQKIPYLSLYTFSLENLVSRSEAERAYLFDLLAQGIQDHMADFIKKGIRLKFVGDRSLFPLQIRDVCERAEAQTAHLHNLQINFLFCYGAQQEMVAGVKTLIGKIKRGELSEDSLTTQTFNDHLWMHGVPEPEIIVRTGGIMRLSNFLLYQAAYSELFFLDCMWPDLTTQDLHGVFDTFQQRKRNFGA